MSNPYMGSAQQKVAGHSGKTFKKSTKKSKPIVIKQPVFCRNSRSKGEADQLHLNLQGYALWSSIKS